MPERVLVTGATGFVGRALVAALAARGTAVVAAARRPTEAARPGVADVTVGEIGPETDWRTAVAGCDAVVHCAAHVHVAPERALAEATVFDRVNHLGSAALFAAAAAAGCRHVVFLSSITVLGDATAGRPFDDEAPPNPRTPYAWSKLAAERALAKAARMSPVRLTMLRPPLVVGPGVGGNLRALARLADTPLPLPFAGVPNRRTLLSLDNLVGAILRVLDRPPNGPDARPFALGDVATLSTADIVRHLRTGFGRPVRLFGVPPALPEVLGRLVRRPGLHRRLFGDLEVSSERFRVAFDWADRTTTEAALVAAATSHQQAVHNSPPV